MLIWPLLIAGVFAEPAVREKVITLFEAFKQDYFDDLAIAVSVNTLSCSCPLVDHDSENAWRNNGD